MQKKLLSYIFLFLTIVLLYYTWTSEQVKNSSQQPVVTPVSILPATEIVTPESIPNVQQEAQVLSGNTGKDVEETFSQRIHVKTDVLEVFFDPKNGNIIQSQLLKYPQNQKISHTPLTLFSEEVNTFYAAQSGFLSATGKKENVSYHSDKQEYFLSKNQSSITVTFTGKTEFGLNFIKKYTFYPNNYTIGLSYAIDNQSITAWSGYYYSQLARSDTLPDAADGTSRYTFFGAATSTPDQHYNKVSFSSMEKRAVDVRNIQSGWVAMLQHYFVSALVPNKEQKVNFYSNVDPKRHIFTIGVLSPSLVVMSGEKIESHWKLYSGPAIAKNLEAVAPNLNLTIDYGWLWFISVLLFWLMQKIYEVIGNWGWSIVLVTVVIKAVFYQLSAKSYRSMAAMKQLQPSIKVLQEKFSADKQQLSREMMALYKKEKVNPLGGCLPMLIQIPVFIALYWVIIESVQLRQAPFIGWIHDLASKDPYYVLPIIMGLTMFIQQKISPPPPDPIQAKVMMLLPVIFTVFFLQFPAGLVLYWIVNNTLSIAQQWYMMQKYSGKKVIKKITKKNK